MGEDEVIRHLDIGAGSKVVIAGTLIGNVNTGPVGYTPPYAGVEANANSRDLATTQRSTFVGRDREIARLNSYVENSQGQWLVLTGPAGFGKSCLLANWITELGDDCVIYHQFTNRSDLSRSSVAALRNLIRQLSTHYGNSLDMPSDLYGLRDVIYHALSTGNAAPGKPLVIVIDALDEADSEFPPFFPSPLPKGVSVVVSCRALEGEWPTYLRAWNSNAASLHLAGMTRDGLKSWAMVFGAGILGEYAKDDVFIVELEAKSQGFPLYVHFLLHDLANMKKQGLSVRAQLEKQPRSFAEYVLQQFQLLARSADIAKFSIVFEYLAVSLGSMPEADLSALTGLSEWDLHAVPWEVNRWLHVENDQTLGRSYTFGHLRLAEEFRHILKTASKKARSHLFDYCLNWRSTKSRYALRYLPRHCSELDASAHAYDLARSAEFLTFQRAAFPSQPELPLITIKAALTLASTENDAVTVAEFVLDHGRQVYSLTLASPLKALVDEGLSSAWQLSSMQAKPNSIVWRLLIAWELLDAGRAQDFADCIQALENSHTFALTGWLSDCGVFALFGISASEPDVAYRIAKSVLDEQGLLLFRKLLTERDGPNAAAAIDSILRETTRSGVLLTSQVVTDAEPADWSDDDLNDIDEQSSTHRLHGTVREPEITDPEVHLLLRKIEALVRHGRIGDAIRQIVQAPFSFRNRAALHLGLTLAQTGRIADAQKQLAYLRDPGSKSILLCEIAQSYKRADSPYLAARTFQSALQSVTTEANSYHPRSERRQLSDVINVLRQRAIAGVIPEKYLLGYRIYVYPEGLALYTWLKGHDQQKLDVETAFTFVLQALAELTNSKEKERELKRLVTFLAACGPSPLSNALCRQAIRHIVHPKLDGPGVIAVQKILRQVELLTPDQSEQVRLEVLTSARQIEDLFVRNGLIAAVAVAMNRSGKTDDAERLASEVYEQLPVVWSVRADDEYRIKMWFFVLRSMARMQQVERCWEVAARTPENSQQGKLRRRAFRQAAKIARKSRDVSEFRELLGQSLLRHSNVHELCAKAKAVATCAAHVAEFDKPGAIDAFEYSLQLLDVIDSDALRVRTTAEIGHWLWRVDPERAAYALNRTLEALNGQFAAGEFADLRSAVAKALVQSKRTTEGLRLFDAAVAIAKSHRTKWVRSQQLRTIAEALAALEEMDLARAVAIGIESETQRCTAIRNLLEMYLLKNDGSAIDDLLGLSPECGESELLRCVVRAGVDRKRLRDAQVVAARSSQSSVKSWALTVVGLLQAKGGFHDDAAMTVLLSPGHIGPKLIRTASITLETSPVDTLTRILPAIGQYYTACFEVCGLLAMRYPERAPEILRIVTSSSV